MSTRGHLDQALEVRKALLDLQKQMLGQLKEEFEKENAREVAPAEWLQVLMMSQRYAWLRDLTTLIADIDMLTELEQVDDEQASVTRSEIERMIFAADDSDSDFAKQYKRLLKAATHIMLPHGKLKSTISPLPEKKHHVDAAATHRKNWHEAHRAQARKKRN
jgi:hypothetical protein